MIADISEFEFEYVYAPGRFPQRQHCFVVNGTSGTTAEEVFIGGWGATQIEALRDLKDEAADGGFDSDFVPSLYHRWLRMQTPSAPRQVVTGYLGNINGPGSDPDTI